MVNKKIRRQAISMNQSTYLDDDYEPVIIEQGGNNTDDFEDQNTNTEEIHEIYDTDIVDTTDTWRSEAVQFLIYSWSKLKEQFINCPDQNKKAFWELVSECMVERGFYFDAQSCKAKWCLLKKMYIYSYNQMHVDNKDSKSFKLWNYYYDMDKAINAIPYEMRENDYDEDDDDDELKDENCVATVSNSLTNVDKCNWSTDATNELIRLYGKTRNKFFAVSQGGKHMLWQEISQELLRLGYQYSANFCNDKWRNLKMSYKKNKERELKYGIQQVKWSYFKDIDNILCPDKYENKFQELNDVITVSLSENIKKEDPIDNNIDYQTTIENTVENNEEDNLGLVSLETWTEAATKCLIELWGAYRQRFLLAPQGKKRLLWNEISEKLCQKGHNYSSIACDRKWRLLKANYLKRKEKYKKSGNGDIKWQYYYDIDRLLTVPAQSISWNLDSTMCLIDAFDHYKEKFMKAPTGEKLAIWKQISDCMAQNGFNYTARACDNKWRTLKNRYHKNRMRFNRNKKVIWVYYEKIDKVLRDVNKERNHRITKASNTYNQSNEDTDDENDNISTRKTNRTLEKNSIDELKEMFRTRNNEFDQRLKEIENDLNNREKSFQNLQQETLDVLKRSNELEVHKLQLLEKLITKIK